MGMPYFIVGKDVSDFFRSFPLLVVCDWIPFLFRVGTMLRPIAKLEFSQPLFEKGNRQVPCLFVFVQQSEVLPFDH